jgi:hypothetical protein
MLLMNRVEGGSVLVSARLDPAGVRPPIRLNAFDRLYFNAFEAVFRRTIDVATALQGATIVYLEGRLAIVKLCSE